MLISNTAIKQRSTVFALMLIIIVVGIYSYATLPDQFFDLVSPPNRLSNPGRFAHSSSPVIVAFLVVY